MRQITFYLDVPLTDGVSYRLIGRKTLTEEDLIGRKQFEIFIAKIKELGCLYRVEDVHSPIFVEGNADFKLGG